MGQPGFIPEVTDANMIILDEEDRQRAVGQVNKTIPEDVAKFGLPFSLAPCPRDVRKHWFARLNHVNFCKDELIMQFSRPSDEFDFFNHSMYLSIQDWHLFFIRDQ